ncbi:J domain-containing protein [Silanimonas lenta]|uniref:J domain-containing protein n=1 Tax=Silanimonas lenta TaxID=265429 RepID=UPI000424A6A0|nr:J domain-containing protein [Silanimonas lenta]GIX38166.1 MAG: membrane protein [Silanimonas sp.]
MRWYGTFLGFLAGWLLLRHPAGGLLGGLIGLAFDRGWFRRRGPDPYTVLDVSPSADNETLRRAWQRLVSQYHPDKLEGVAPELRAQADRRLREINRAYEELRRLRGF